MARAPATARDSGLHRLAGLGSLALRCGVPLALAAVAIVTPASARTPGAVIELRAPARALAGGLVEIDVRARHVSGLAGYETQLLFDTRAARLSHAIGSPPKLRKLGWDVRELGPTRACQRDRDRLLLLPSVDVRDRCVAPRRR